MAKPRREVMHRVVHRLSDGEALHERRVYARTSPTLAPVALPAFAAEPADLRAGDWLHATIRHMEAGDA